MLKFNILIIVRPCFGALSRFSCFLAILDGGFGFFAVRFWQLGLGGHRQAIAGFSSSVEKSCVLKTNSLARSSFVTFVPPGRRSPSEGDSRASNGAGHRPLDGHQQSIVSQKHISLRQPSKRIYKRLQRRRFNTTVNWPYVQVIVARNNLSTPQKKPRKIEKLSGQAHKFLFIGFIAVLQIVNRTHYAL